MRPVATFTTLLTAGILFAPLTHADPGPAVGSPCDHATFNAVTTSNIGTTVRCVGVMDAAWYRWEPDTGPVSNPHQLPNGMDY
jgi:hypothetical protein